MSLITIRTSGVRVDAYLSAIFAMAEAELSKDEIIDSDEYLFTVEIDQREVEQTETEAGRIGSFLPEVRCLRLPEVKHMTDISTATIYRLTRRGDFPDNIRLLPNAVVWKSDEIQEWIKQTLRQATVEQKEGKP